MALWKSIAKGMRSNMSFLVEEVWPTREVARRKLILKSIAHFITKSSFKYLFILLYSAGFTAAAGSIDDR